MSKLFFAAILSCKLSAGWRNKHINRHVFMECKGMKIKARKLAIQIASVLGAASLLAGCGGSGGIGGSGGVFGLKLSGPNALYNNLQAVKGGDTNYTAKVQYNAIPVTAGSLAHCQLNIPTLDQQYVSVTTLPVQNDECRFDVQDIDKTEKDVSIPFEVTATYKNKVLSSNTETVQVYDFPSPTSVRWPVKVVNTSGKTVYVFAQGDQFNSNAPQTGGEGTLGVIKFTPSSQGQNDLNGTIETYDAAKPRGSAYDSVEIPAGATKTLELPYAVSGRIYFSFGQKMQHLTLRSNGGIHTPSPWINDEPGDNKNTIFTWAEFNFAPTFASKNGPLTGNEAAVINQTNVDQFGWPYYIESSSNAYVPSNKVGYAPIMGQPITREQVIDAYKQKIQQDNVPAIWGKLIQEHDGKVMRIMSPLAFDGVLKSQAQTYLKDYIADLCTEYANGGINVEFNKNNQFSSTSAISGGTGVCNVKFNNGDTVKVDTNLLFSGGDGSDLQQMVSGAFMGGQLPASNLQANQYITPVYLQSQTTAYEPNSIGPNTDRSYYSAALSSVVKNTQCTLTTNLPDGKKIGQTIPCGIYTYAYDDLLGRSSTMADGNSNLTDGTVPPEITITLDPEN